VTAGPWFGLLGSGEFEPWARAVDRWLLERATGDGRVLILPTASAAEGDTTFGRWAAMGLKHYASLGVTAEVVPLKTREDAAREDLMAKLDGASVAFFSGGNPASLAGVLHGTPFLSALLTEMGRGMAYAGCSAGVACLGEVAPDSAARSTGARVWQPGLRLFPKVYFGPHWDALDRFVPGLRRFIEESVPADSRLLAIDEHTAVVGDGSSWSVTGRGGAHLMEGGAWTTFPAGASFEAAIASAETIRAAGMPLASA
jgi:cyanophycinase-like exopeptidase